MNKLPTKSPIIPKAVTLIAAVLLGLSGARSVGVFLQAYNKQPGDENNSLQHSANSIEAKVDYGKLANLHLLGKAENNAIQMTEKQEITKAPETNLNLKLIGILFNGKSEDGYAIISESGKAQKTFHKGDKLPGNATLYSVESNMVVLERNGRHETLSLLKLDINAKVPSNSDDQVPNTPMQAWKRSRNNDNQQLPEIPPRTFSKTGHTF